MDANYLWSSNWGTAPKIESLQRCICRPVVTLEQGGNNWHKGKLAIKQGQYQSQWRDHPTKKREG